MEASITGPFLRRNKYSNRKHMKQAVTYNTVRGVLMNFIIVDYLCGLSLAKVGDFCPLF